MKKQIRNILLALLLLALCAPASLAAPEYLNVEGFPLVKEPVVLKGFGSHSTGNADWNDMIVLDKYEEMTGVKIEWQTIQAHEYPEQLNIRMASGDIPDIFLRAKLSTVDQVKFGMQGLLLPVNNYLEFMPNFAVILEGDPVAKSNATAPDGNIYSLPTINASPASQYNHYKLYINQVWLDKVGLGIPATTEDYYQTLKAFKEQDANDNGAADEIGWTGDNSLKIVQYLMGSWGIFNRGYTKTDFGRGVEYDLDPETGLLRYAYTVPEYKEVLSYLNRLYTEGLIDPEIFTIQSQSANNPAKAAENKIGSCHTNKETDLGADLADQWVFVPQLTGPNGDHLNVYVNCTAMVGMAAIGGNCKYPEAAARWFDYFYSEEGATFIWGGVEGETYEVNDQGKVVRTQKVISKELSMANYTPAANGQFPYCVFEIFDELTPAYQQALEQIKQDQPEEVWAPFMFLSDEQMILDEVLGEVSAYHNEMRSKFISGDESLDNWDAYVAQMQRLGVDQYVEILNTAYARMKAE
ncbi:MAG TPA: extracellular solute-binding protein [Clostridia bacterium]|nr:extracellular solute-binding protein [Clostridia bacterium]